MESAEMIEIVDRMGVAFAEMSAAAAKMGAGLEALIAQMRELERFSAGDRPTATGFIMLGFAHRVLRMEELDALVWLDQFPFAFESEFGDGYETRD